MPHYSSLGRQWKPRAWASALFTSRHPNLPRHIPSCLVGVVIGLLCLISPWLALSVVLGVIVCIAALSKPTVLCYLMVAAIALTSGMERGVLLPFLRPNEAGLLFSAGIAFVAILANKRRGVCSSRYANIAFPVLFSGTVIIPGLSYSLRGAQLTTDDVFFLLAPLQYFVLFRLFADLPESEADRRRLILWMILCGSAVAVVGLMQAGRVWFVTELLDRWYSSSHGAQAADTGRVTSLMAAWNVLGIFLMVNLLIVWALLSPNSKAPGKVGMTVPVALCAVCLVASGSFASILGLIIGVLVIELLRRRKMREVPTLLLTVVGVAIAICFFQPLIQPLVRQRLDYQFQHGGIVPQTLLFRFQVWREVYWPAIRENLLWGNHLTIPPTFAWQWTESEYLLLLFRFGVIGLLTHLAWVGLTLGWLCRRFRQSDGFLRSMVTGALAMLVVLSIAGLTNEVLTFSGTADYLWIMLALVAGSEEARIMTMEVL